MEKEIQFEKMKINGEAGDVRGETIDPWKERLPELLQGIQVVTSGILMKLPNREKRMQFLFGNQLYQYNILVNQKEVNS